MILSLLESAGNHALQLDPESLNRLAELEGRTIVMNIRHLDISIALSPGSDGISVSQEDGIDADVILSAAPSVFARIAARGLDDSAYAPGELEIRGDAILAQRFANILAELDIDWEELLAQQTGDIPARAIARQLTRTLFWARETRLAMKQNLEEYLVEEARLAAPRAEVEALLSAVDDLRADTDRFALMINKLQLSAGTPA